MGKTDLKPCPFCGAEVKIVWAGGFISAELPMIVCNNCGMLLSNKFNENDTKKFLKEKWNARVEVEG